MITSDQICNLEIKIRKILNETLHIPVKERVFYFEERNREILYDTLVLLRAMLVNYPHIASTVYPSNSLLKIMSYRFIAKTKYVCVNRYRIYNSSGKYTYRNVNSGFVINRETINYINKITTRIFGTPIIEINENGTRDK